MAKQQRQGLRIGCRGPGRRKVLAFQKRGARHSVRARKPCLPHVKPTTTRLPFADSNEVIAKSVVRSILKRPGRYSDPASPSKTEQRGPAAKRVHFKNSLTINEYARYVGGSCCVPQDGSTLALGLGSRARVISEPESPKRRKVRNCGDGLAFIPVAQRERLLRASELSEVGAASAPGRAAWAAHRADLRCVQRSRKAELENSTNWQPMADSLEKAKQRADKLMGCLVAKSSTKSLARRTIAAVAKTRCKGKALKGASPAQKVTQSKSSNTAAPAQGATKRVRRHAGRRRKKFS